MTATEFKPEKDIYRTSRISYIIEAALEYFIAMLISDSFLATLLTRTGVSDASAGIVTQLASLAFTMQLVSVFVRPRHGVKLLVTVLHLVNQLTFVSLYLIPGTGFPQSVKVAVFVVMFLGGHIIANIAQPYKLSWLMSLVPDKSRGRFTANKEIISLLGGMAFSYAMGAVVDHYKDIGDENMGFTLCGITIFVLAVLHTVSLVIVKEKPEETATDEKVSFGEAVRKTFTNKALLKILMIDVLWYVTTGIAVSFYGVYETNDLGFSLKFCAVITILYSLVRSGFSRFLGGLADKYSWAKMLLLCFGIAGLAFFVNIFTVPSNGKVMFTLYYCLYAVAMAGINSGLMNITFDYVPHEDRAAALGIKYALGGTVGFLSSIVGSVIVKHIQENGNTFAFFGEVYAQQILSAIAFAVCIILVLYIRRFVSARK